MDHWQYQLAAAKQNVKTTGAYDEPTWTANLSLAQRYSATLTEQLSHLPTMVRVESEPARRAYFDKVVQELIRIAYVQARVAQLSEQPTAQPEQQPVANIGQMIKQLAMWLRI